MKKKCSTVLDFAFSFETGLLFAKWDNFIFIFCKMCDLIERTVKEAPPL